MVYKKTIYVKSKVFKAEDIIELVNILEKEVKERDYKIRCNILFEDKLHAQQYFHFHQIHNLHLNCFLK